MKPNNHNPPSGREHLTCSVQNCRPTQCMVISIWSCSALSSTRPVTCFLSDRLCVSNAKRWFKATHTLPSVDALWVNMSFSMRKSVSQTLFRPLKNVRPPSQSIPQVFLHIQYSQGDVMFYGVLERTRGMLSNTSALQESLENTKLNDITPSHTNVKVNIRYQLFLTFTSRARFKSAAVFCGDFGKICRMDWNTVKEFKQSWEYYIHIKTKINNKLTKCQSQCELVAYMHPPF